ncbi:MAG: hypothetical protein Q8N93_01360, partial [Bacillota bacterium]|nr:hypothetical protein [Bacillota bacterium]
AFLQQQVADLVRTAHVEELFELAAEEQRATVEAKPLILNATLTRGLKNMPAIWLDGMCDDWEIRPVRTRKEREEEIIAYLGDDGNLGRLVAKLDEDEVELLRFLLGKGGWSKMGSVSRRFGTMDGDGYFWNELAPVSPLGSLWSQALVMVGRTQIDGRYYRVAVIPAELREKLPILLG